MARHPSLLASSSPSNIVSADVTIGHLQLRDLIICPREAGVVNYVHGSSIVEHDLHAHDLAPRRIAELPFLPNTLASIPIPGTDKTLLAAGGQEAEIHLSLQRPSSRSQRRESDSPQPRCNNAIWQYFKKLTGSINNSVLLTSLSLTRCSESSVEPRLAVSNNDYSVKFYDIPIRGEYPPGDLRQCGYLKLEEPVNHSSISPDGRTLLSVGDSPRIYLHQVTGGCRITFTPILTLNIPPPDARFYSPSLAASFSTAFSADGMKFAVASQEGVVAVWDVRSTKPMRVIQTDKTRVPPGQSGNGEASGMLSDDPWDWTRGSSRAPGWGARNVKFGTGGTHGLPGHEIMTFTEHTSLLHVLDARTFETEEIVRMPSVRTAQSTSSRAPSMLSTSSDGSRFSPGPTPSSFRHVVQPLRALRVLEEDSRASPFSDNSLVSSWWSSRRATQHQEGMREDDHIYDDAVFLPFEDAVLEDNVREVFARHGIRTRHAHRTDSLSLPSRGSGGGRNIAHSTDPTEVRRDDDMDIDEPEADCLSRAPSRSSSPPPSVHLPIQSSPSPTRNTALGRYMNARQSSRPRRRTITRDDSAAEQHQQITTDNYDIDIAGTCFDPHGGFIYVATTDSISEWAIRGAEKRWWGHSNWA
ncbi:hypothetical protein F5I97DRAFT_1441168 [Phlebopus sp. FC_14]|nr:hypothetical protein F5I97DRAFT_1441168 [Phlebopus sp. FC_14]